MPTHKLSVELRVTKLDKAYKKFLKGNNTVRDEQFALVLKATNVGQNMFPGGKISTLKIQQHGELAGLLISWSVEELAKMPTLQAITPRGTWESQELFVVLNWEGLTSVTFNVTANDNQPIEVYHRGNLDPVEGAWTAFLHSINREDLLVLTTLDKIIEELEGLKEEIKKAGT